MYPLLHIISKTISLREPVLATAQEFSEAEADSLEVSLEAGAILVQTLLATRKW